MYAHAIQWGGGRVSSPRRVNLHIQRNTELDGLEVDSLITEHLSVSAAPMMYCPLTGIMGRLTHARSSLTQ